MEKIRAYKSVKPFFTFAFIALCVLLYFSIGFLSNFGDVQEDTYKLFGAPYAVDIYRGHFWGVVFNSLLHVYWYQLVLNLIFVFFFLRAFEIILGPYKLFIFGLLASTVTSCIQLALSDDAGIGLAGVNFSLLGFFLVRRNIDERFKFQWIYPLALVLFILFFVMYYLNLSHGWNFGLAAMLGGFVWGALVGFMYFKRTFRFIAPVVLASNLICFTSIVYAPWSAEWNCAKGVRAHEKKNLTLAKTYYEKTLVIDPENYLATQNLQLIRINEWSDQAYQAHLNGEYSKARMLYQKILTEDPFNKWAQANLKELQ